MNNKEICHISYNFYSYGKMISRQLKKDGYIVDDYVIKKPSIAGVKKRLLKRRGIISTKDIQNYYIDKSLWSYLDKRKDKIDVILVSLLMIDKEKLIKIKELCPKAVLVLILLDDLSFISEEDMESLEQYDLISSYSKIDSDYKGYFYNPNFWVKKSDKKKKYNLAFVGTKDAHRIDFINRISECRVMDNVFIRLYISGSGVKDYIKSIISKKKSLRGAEKYLTGISTSENRVRKIFSRSRCILDISRENQNGLSFRPFYSMSMKAKLITTNKNILNYDFYNSNNVYVIDYDNPIMPSEEFFSSQYVDIPDSTLEYYNVENWCDRLMRCIETWNAIKKEIN